MTEVLQPTSIEEPVEERALAAPAAQRSASQPLVKGEQPPPEVVRRHTATAELISQGLNIATLGASFGFALAKAGTQLGFDITRGILNGVDYATGGISKPVTSTVGIGLNVGAFLAQAGITVGEQATALTLTATSKSFAFVEEFYGNGEAVRALAEFLLLVRREWKTVGPYDPPGGVSQFSLPAIARATSAWALLTTLTNRLEPFEYSSELTEIPIRHSNIEQDFEGETLFEFAPTETDDSEGFRTAEVTGAPKEDIIGDDDSTEAIRQVFRRYASVCLGTYGGLGMLFFGVPIKSTETANRFAYTPSGGSPAEGEARAFSYWDMLNGVHDRELIEQLGALEPGALSPDEAPELPMGRRAPRHYLVTDHPARAIAVCIRGTLSMDDVATDLACEEKPFPQQEGWSVPPKKAQDPEHVPVYHCHGGMLDVAVELGRPEGALVRRLTKMLNDNPGYELHVVGHSLGAGLASILALLWADPDSALTTERSPLPTGVRVTAFCFATPAVFSDDLGRRVAPKLVRSCVVGDDVVPRFSLNHVLDIRCAAAWLCAGDPGTINRVFDAARRQRNDGLEYEQEIAEEEFLIALRKSLEASMQMASLFPPGRVFLLNRDEKEGDVTGAPKFFEVTGDVARVFKQIRFGKGMLSDHLPQRYARLIADHV